MVVIGGGHSGCEAAAASARIGANTLLITPKISTIGEMSCNPSIGGIGKGNIVCEVDALDGIMGVAADEGGILFRLLNRSKGPAVRGPRAQQDRDVYATAVRNLLAKYENLEILEEMVQDVIISNDSADKRIRGVKLSNGKEIEAKSVVITTGTFLRGKCHVSTTRFVRLHSYIPTVCPVVDLIEPKTSMSLHRMVCARLLSVSWLKLGGSRPV